MVAPLQCERFGSEAHRPTNNCLFYPWDTQAQSLEGTDTHIRHSRVCLRRRQ